MQETHCGSRLRDRAEDVAKAAAICRLNLMTCRQSIWQDGQRSEYVRKAITALFILYVFQNSDRDFGSYNLACDLSLSQIHLSYFDNGS